MSEDFLSDPEIDEAASDAARRLMDPEEQTVKMFKLPPEKAEATFKIMKTLADKKQKLGPFRLPEDFHLLGGSIVKLEPYYDDGPVHTEAKLSINRDSFRVIADKEERAHTVSMSPDRIEDNSATIEQAASLLDLFVTSSDVS